MGESILPLSGSVPAAGARRPELRPLFASSSGLGCALDSARRFPSWGTGLQSLLAKLDEDRQPAAAAKGRVPVLLPVALDQTYDYLLPDGI